MQLTVKRLDVGLPIPHYAHEGDAGLDLYSAQDVTLRPGHRCLISTGLAVAIPPGFAGFVLPRSGLALKKGLSLVNSPGLIDSHYRGEIKVIAVNLDRVAQLSISRGDKVAQLVIQPVVTATLVEVDDLDVTVRGVRGFGSSGE